MRAPAESSDWLISELNATIDRLPQTFDRAGVKAAAAAILSHAARRPAGVNARDLFLIYVPEDRLPVAAPLAIELTKRRVSVAFAEYEVATAAEFAAAVARGLDAHRGGVVLWTSAFDRRRWEPPKEGDRLQILPQPEAVSTAAELANWVRSSKSGM